MSEAQTSQAVPQAATNLLAVAVEAILKGELGKPIDQWLKVHKDIASAVRRHVDSILLFFNVLDESRRLIPEVRAWRGDHESLSQALVQRAKQAYVSAGCHASQAELLGNPLLSKSAIGKLLEDEPPFRRLENPDTRNNAIRFARHLHETIVNGTLVPQHSVREDNAQRSQPARTVAQERPTPAPVGTERPPAVNDLGTIVNFEPYRVARVRGDQWIYGKVEFECPQREGDFAWLAKPDLDEQARWLEQLAAALLQEADQLRARAEMT